MAVDLNATEGHSVKCSRIAPLPATEQRLERAKRPVGGVRPWLLGDRGRRGVCSVSGSRESSSARDGKRDVTAEDRREDAGCESGAVEAPLRSSA